LSALSGTFSAVSAVGCGENCRQLLRHNITWLSAGFPATKHRWYKSVSTYYSYWSWGDYRKNYFPEVRNIARRRT